MDDIEELLRLIRGPSRSRRAQSYATRQRYRFLKRSTNQFDTPMNTKTDGHFLSASDLTDFITSGIVAKRTIADLPTYSKEVSVLCERREFNAFLLSKKFEGMRPIQTSSYGGIFIAKDEKDTEAYFTYRLSNTGCSIAIYGGAVFIASIHELFTTEFMESDSNLEWIYGTDGSSCAVPLRKDRNPVSEMYSFLKNETLENYYDRFMSSNASILLLIGKPGTGKTSFIRGFLQHTKSNAILTYDPAVLARDHVFARFIEDDSNVFIIEDADLLLGSRKEGNDMMHKFLNVGDGLVTTRGKKMIFSTNLPSIKDVDPALVRPGRCFDVLNFEELEHTRAEVLSKVLGIEMPAIKKKSYSLAEMFHTQTHAEKTKRDTSTKVGFY